MGHASGRAGRRRVCRGEASEAAGGGELCWGTTVGAERAGNVHLGGKSEAEFVALGKERDAALPTPKLLLPAIQVNIRAGRFPPAEANGVSYLRIPVKVRG